MTSQNTLDSNTKQVVIPLSEEDFSKLQSLSDFTTIPLPILCRALLRRVVSRNSTVDDLDDLLFSTGSVSRVASLSNREMDVLNLVAQGIPNREIASALKLSEQTVKNHVSSILSKMKANNRTQATLLALKRNRVQTGTVETRLPARKRATGGRILILEGPSALSEELARCLTGVGFKVARIPNNPETLMTLHMFKPDIVIVDEMVADSFEVCKQMRNAVGAPVLIVGEDAGTDIWTKALVEAGADFYLRKPFESEELGARLRAILARYHKTRTGSIQYQNQEGRRVK